MRLKSIRSAACALKRSKSGVSAVEFALILPLFISLMAAGTEMMWMMLTTIKVQRLATMTADLVARDGASTGRLSEGQIYDILSAMDLAAKPLHMRERGRLVVTAVVGEDANSDGAPDVNRIKWQRFEGALTGAVPQMGCWSDSTVARNVGRQLRFGEPMFHVQVTYAYEPILGGPLVNWFGIPQNISKTAAFRGRGAIFQPVLTMEGYTPKTNCHSADGL
jgi:Flp pilus assembly protein TadG